MNWTEELAHVLRRDLGEPEAAPTVVAGPMPREAHVTIPVMDDSGVSVDTYNVHYDDESGAYTGWGDANG